MLQYRTPGVYVEWLEPPPTVGIARTDIAGFVGIAERGRLHRPVKITSFSQFRAVFGGHIPQGFLAYSVEGFFLNRGRECWVVRVDNPTEAAKASLDVFDAQGKSVCRLEATSEGAWGNAVAVRAIRRGTGFDLLVRLPDGSEHRHSQVTDWPAEKWDATPYNRGEEKFEDIEDHLPTQLVKRSPGVTYRGAVGQLSLADSGERLMTGGRDGLAQLNETHFLGDTNQPNNPFGLAALAAIREVALIAIPDLMPKEPPPEPQPPRPPRCHALEVPVVDQPPIEEPVRVPAFGETAIREIQYAAMEQCESRQDRFAVLDAPPERDPVTLEKWRRDLGESSYAALYAPWILVDDPLRISGPVRAIPPSGHVAGMLARVDRFRGVHKPPANEILEGARSPLFAIDDRAHGDLNERGVNAIRAIPGRGVRVLGERTLFSEPLLRYVNVRRLLIMIRRSLEASTQWIPFEPNNAALRLDVDRAVRGFLEDLFRRGMLDGATPSEAYSVVCDATNNDEVSAGAGQMLCEIGVQPPWPAEFVRIVIGKTQTGIEVIAERGAADA